MSRSLPWALACLLVSPAVAAQSRCEGVDAAILEARPLLFNRARQPHEALARLRPVLERCPTDRILEIYVGIALEQTGAFLDAEAHLEHGLSEVSSPTFLASAGGAGFQQTMRPLIVASLERVRAHLGSLRVVVRDGVQATLEVENGPRVALPSADPIRVFAGDVTFTVRAPGHVPVTRVVHVEHDDVTVQEITLDAEPPPAPVAAPAPVVLRVPEVLHRTVRPSPMRTAGWITAGVGAASLVAGVGVWIATALDADRVHGATLSSADPDLRAWANVSSAMGPTGDPCTSTAGSTEDRNTVRQLCAQNETMRAFAYGLGIAGLAATAAGLVLALTSHDRVEERRERVTVSVAATPTSAGASVAVPF